MTNKPLGFGPFRLDRSSGLLTGASGRIPLTPKALAVLDYLAARPGRLVGKRELLEAIWPGIYVSDASLKVCIREIRKALQDDPKAPRFIETAHRRGYRFIGTLDNPTGAADDPVPHASPAEPASIDVPPVRYARSGHVNIAYQVVGGGPVDLVFVMGWVSHLEYFWREPSFARFLRRLGSISRLILFDKRGTGLSDAVPVDQLPSLEQRMDDVRAVMDAAGSRRAVLMGVSEGGPMCSLFAATYPEKTEALIMVGSYARRLRDDDYPWGPTPDQRDAFLEEIVNTWGGPVGIDQRAPSKAGDRQFREWWAAYLRMGASPGAAVALTRMNSQIDVRGVLPSIRVPTLVIHRAEDRCLLVEEGRYLASRIPGARLVELPGADHLPFAGDQDALLGHVERFLIERRVPISRGMVLAAALSVLLDEPAARLPELTVAVRGQIERFRGTPAGVAPSLAGVFDGPSRAVRCGSAIAELAARTRARVRCGIHVGECEVADRDVSGPALEEAALVARAAAAGEVLVTRTVVDLVPGAGLQFVDRGAGRLGARDLPLLAVTR
jgi:pimeloyl-ACP methyl ester carboxylesterase/DNA-binding winged helix-turn-helix (wHTH) protein